jgi:hypothetical protein
MDGEAISPSFAKTSSIIPVKGANILNFDT